MDDFPSLRSLEGIGRSLGTERPSFSPLQENELAEPANPRQSEGRERPEERFEARVEEAERRARGERTREREEAAVESRSNQEPRESEEPGGSKRASETEENISEESTETQTAASKKVKELAEVPLRFAGSQVAPLAGAAVTTLSNPQSQSTGTNPTQATPNPAALELGAIPAGAPASGVEYGALTTQEPGGQFQPLSANALTLGQGSTEGESFQRGGGRNLEASFQSTGSTGTATATTSPAEAFGALLSSEISESSSATKTVSARADAAARELPPTQREVELAGDVLRQFRMQLQPGLNQATIHLRPAHLGRVAIRLHVEEGRLRATLRAEKPETLGILEAHLPELRAALEGQGFEAQEFDLGLGDSSQSDFQEFFHEREATRKSEPASAQDAHTESDLLQGALQRKLNAGNSSVDTYA